MKKLISIFVVVFMLVSLVGCGGTQQASDDSVSNDSQQDQTADGNDEETSEQESPSESPKENIELSFTWWGGENRHEKFNKILDLYEQKNSNIKVIRQYAGWDDYWTKLATQAAGGNLPDLFGMTFQYFGEYASKGVMTPLQEYIDSGILDLSNFGEGSMDIGKWEDTFYMVTFGNTASGLAYNKTKLNEVGVEPPTKVLTWKEYKDFLINLQSKLPEGTWAANDDVAFDHVFENMVRQRGYELIKDGQIGYEKDVVIEFYTFWNDLLEAGAIPPPEVMAEQQGIQWADSLMSKGKIVFFLTNINQLKIYQGYLEDDLDIMRGPYFEDAVNKNVEMPQPSSWCIAQNSKYKEEAAKLISWFVNDEEVQEIFDIEFGAPGSIKINEMIINNMDPENDLIDDAKKQELELVNEIIDSIIYHPGRPAGAPALMDDMKKKWEAIKFGQMTIEEAVDAHFETVNSILAS